MKKKFIMFATGIFAIATITTIVSCNKDSDYDSFCGLDINDNTPLTRSIANETGSGIEDSSKVIPINKDECMLYAIVRMAERNNIPIKVKENKDGQLVESEKKIGPNYYASSAYEYIKSIATQNTWPVCDVNGNPIAGENPQSYSGGAMPLSIGAAVAQQAGILSGTIMHFDSYDEVISFINTPQWKYEHPDGSYLISNDSEKHVGICDGVSSGGNLKYIDANAGDHKYTKKKNGNDEWTVIF